MMSKKRIFTKEIAMKLIRLGHEVVRFEPHRDDEKLMIFVFEKTNQFMKDFNAITNK